jgi:hypothetical protein
MLIASLRTAFAAAALALAGAAAHAAAAPTATTAAPAAMPPAAAAAVSTAAPAASAADRSQLAPVRERLQLDPLLRGEFEQRKTLAGFRNPIVTRGDFVVARGQGVQWHTAQPFEGTLVVTRTRLVTLGADGTPGDALDAQAEPALRQVSELVFALLGADLDALAARFTLQGEAVGAHGWRLVMMPRDPRLAAFLARATLEGDRWVESVRLEEARGDVTQIRFSHQATLGALTPEQAARFR